MESAYVYVITFDIDYEGSQVVRVCYELDSAVLYCETMGGTAAGDDGDRWFFNMGPMTGYTIIKVPLQ